MIYVQDPIKKVEKGWGYETWIHNSPEYCGKILTVYGNKKCSLHYHRKKTETFYLMNGLVKMRIYYPDKDITSDFHVYPNQLVEIPRNTIHQFVGVEDVSKIIEFSTQHFEEDSYRMEKGD